jgi:hypothetical protein
MEWVLFKDAIVAALGMSRDTLHIAGGLGLFGLIALLLRCTVRHALPWLGVLALTLTNEGLDQMASYGYRASFDWGASLHDLSFTLMLPTFIMAAGCVARLFPKPTPRRRSRTHDPIAAQAR